MKSSLPSNKVASQAKSFKASNSMFPTAWLVPIREFLKASLTSLWKGAFS
jgi:hypothetical protein